MTALLGIFVPIIVAVLAGIGAYLTAVRKLSGKITTSTAEELWAESRSMRTQLTEQIISLQNRLTLLDTARDSLLFENNSLRTEIATLKTEVQDLKAVINKLVSEGVKTK